MEISLYGGTGFIGSMFCTFQPLFDEIHVIPRWSVRPVNTTLDGQILYLISTTHNYNVMQDATIDVQTNLMHFTEALDSWRHNNPMAVFNFVSSWFVYGNEYPAVGWGAFKKAYNDTYGENYITRSGGALETDECHPRGFYSITKRCAEQLLMSYAETFNLKYRILRLSNVLGKSDKNISKQKNAFQYLINEMKEDREIEIYENGDFYRNYIHVEDCCDAIQLVMKEGDKNAIYNVGAHNRKFIDMIQYAAKKLDYTVPLKFIDQKSFHKTVQAKSFMMDTERLEDLGFKPNYTMETMIDSLL